VLHDSQDPVLIHLLAAHGTLRLNPQDPARWDNALARIAFEQYLRHILHHFGIDLVIDIGANRGQFARTLRRLGYSGEIVSFEPIDHLCRELASTASSDGAWFVHRCAIGATETSLPLNVYADNLFSSLHKLNSTATAEFGSLARLDRTEVVPVRTLDSWWPELTRGRARRILIKTDTQGNERDVVAGARQSLAAAQVFLTEAALIPLYNGSADYFELRELLARAQYVQGALFPIACRSSDLALIEMDCFFIRAGAAA
jgi:FkbM family methyltransferase